MGGGDSRLIDALLDRGLTCLTVLDISAAALQRARARLGPRQDRVRWIEADVTTDWAVPGVDVWHDRAVFHFLTEACDRAHYIARVHEGLRVGGHLVIAAFAPDGPTRCSGLATARYSPEQLSTALGTEFRLVETVPEHHRTPAGGTQSFLYNRFVRVR